LGIESGDLTPRVWTDATDGAFADKLFARPPLQGRRVVALFAGALHVVRAYGGYGSALRDVCKEHDLTLVALGSAEHFEVNQAQLDVAGVSHVNLSGHATLRQGAEVLRRCALAVGAETGLAHMCCAVGTPNVIVLGGGHFGRFMPYAPLTTAVSLPIECYGCNWNCRYTRAHCVADVEPRVLELAIQTALAAPAPAKPRVIVQAPSLWPMAPALPRYGLPSGLVDVTAFEFLSAGPAGT
jgi:hypothetical protein